MKNTKQKEYFFNIPVKHFINWDSFKSIEEIEDHIYTSDWNYKEYITDDYITGDMEGEATSYIKGRVKKELESQSKIKLDDYQQEIKNDILRVIGSVYETNVKDEWMAEFRNLLNEAIRKTADDLKADNFEYVYDKATEGERDAKQVKFYFTKEQAKKLIDDFLSTEEQTKDIEYDVYNIPEFSSYFLDNEIYQITDNQRDNIDRYGTLGSITGWVDEFQEWENTTTQILRDIQEYKEKKDNKKYLSSNIVKNTANIRQIIAEYSTDEDYNAQILRQIGGIEATIKKATK